MKINTSSENSNSGPYQNAQSPANLVDFLKLFVTQMQYQDPLNPVKDQEFIAQMAQFSQLDETRKMNGHLAELLRMQQGNLSFQGLQLLGKEVEVCNGEDSFFGVVEGINFINETMNIIVAGRPVELGHIVQVLAQGRESKNE